MKLIDLDQLLKYPLRRESALCDEEHADPHFLNGVESILEWAQTLPTLTQPNEWISVEERLPESIVNKVLVYCENGYIGYGHYEKYQGEETWYNLESGEPFSSWSLQNCLPYKVTHWMPLPKPPETMTKRMEAVDDA